VNVGNITIRPGSALDKNYDVHILHGTLTVINCGYVSVNVEDSMGGFSLGSVVESNEDLGRNTVAPVGFSRKIRI
jgi:hypothetical protein